jgi:hypothetical protein
MVEPVHPAEGGELEVVDAAPGPVAADALELVEPDKGLGLGVVVGVADGADGGDDAGLGESV